MYSEYYLHLVYYSKKVLAIVPTRKITLGPSYHNRIVQWVNVYLLTWQSCVHSLGQVVCKESYILSFNGRGRAATFQG